MKPKLSFYFFREVNIHRIIYKIYIYEEDRVRKNEKSRTSKMFTINENLFTQESKFIVGFLISEQCHGTHPFHYNKINILPNK